MTLYHGTARTDWIAHIGACLTDSCSAAESYADWRNGRVLIVEIALDGLTVEDRSHEVDRDSQSWPGDTAADLARLAAEGVDVVRYEDEDERGKQLTCYRLVSARAVAAIAEIAEAE